MTATLDSRRLPMLIGDDVPRTISPKLSRADKAFNWILKLSSVVVLVVLVGIMVFLTAYGWAAIKKGGLSIFTDQTWSPDSGHFGAMPLLVGTVVVALVSIVIALPISICTALMINEYAPRQLKPVLTSVVDLLATVPSIVYGFWGLKLISGLQANPASWLANHFGFVPLFRTPTPGSYVKSVFACGLICAVTIIPIVTSISREVMAQAPRDACEAALGLGGTKWGMVSTVILPFSRNGIVGATLLGIGRGLGETMIVVLVLSQANVLTPAILGPNGLGTIPKEITDYFEAGSPIVKSGLIMLGLILFLATLGVNIIARNIALRTGSQD